jgi:hypothetical protein
MYQKDADRMRALVAKNTRRKTIDLAAETSKAVVVTKGKGRTLVNPSAYAALSKGIVDIWPLAAWSPHTHRDYPASFKSRVFVMLCCLRVVFPACPDLVKIIIISFLLPKNAACDFPAWQLKFHA